MGDLILRSADLPVNDMPAPESGIYRFPLISRRLIGFGIFHEDPFHECYLERTFLSLGEDSLIGWKT